MRRKHFKNSTKLFLILFLFIALSDAIFNQEDKSKVNVKLREEILAMYKSKGESGLREFFKKKETQITNKFILDFAEAGVNEKREDWLKACEILAEAKKDEKTLAYVLYKTGVYFRFIANYQKALEHLDMAFVIYQELNYSVGLGSIWSEKGDISLIIGEYLKASEMYDRALFFFEKEKYLLGQGNVCMNKGDIYFHTGDSSKAFEMYEKALLLFENVKDDRGQGNVYRRKGSLYLIVGEYSKSLENNDKALFFFKKERFLTGQGYVFLSNGDVFYYTGNNSRAFEMYKKALQLFEKSGEIFSKAIVYMKMGNIHKRTGKHSKALEMYDKAIPLFDKVKSPIGLGNIYMEKGDIYLRIGENSKALEMIGRAIPLYEKVKSPIGLGNVYMKKGEIYLNNGKYSKALDMYNKALPFYEKVNSPIPLGSVYLKKAEIYLRIPNSQKVIEMCDKALPFIEMSKSPINKANLYKIKGDAYLKIGETYKALEMHFNSLALFQKVENYVGQGSSYLRIGDIYSYIGEYLKALEMFDKSLIYFIKVKSLNNQGVTYSRKGDLNFSIGENLRAFEMFNKAFTIFRRTGDPNNQGYVYLRKGDIYFDFGDNSKAVKMYNKALTLFKRSGTLINQGNVYWSKGNVYLINKQNLKSIEMQNKAMLFFKKAQSLLDQGNVYLSNGKIYFEIRDYLRSIEMYNKALAIYKKTGVIRSESIALHCKAKALVKLGNKKEALYLFEKGIAILEKIRMQTFFSEMKKVLMGKVYEQYEETARFMLENGYFENGFRYAESMKARVFLDQMGEGLTPMEKGLKPDLKEKRDNLVGKLSYLTKQMQETPGKDEKKLEKLKEEYHKVESDFEDLLIKIRLDNPLYAGVKYPQPVTVQDVQENVLKPGETLISYFISQDALYAFIVSKDMFKVIPIKIGEKEITGLVEKYNSTIRENNSFTRHCAVLYDKLFQPLEKYLKPGWDIIIAPDGELAKIPFETFVIGKNDKGQSAYLLDKYRISYIQSASLLSLLRKYYQRDNTSQNFIGFGDPVYDYKSFQAGKKERSNPTPARSDEITELFRDQYDREKGAMGRLQASGEEIKSIASLFKNNNYKSISYLRKEATEEKAKAHDMRDFDYIHFSCHGVLGDMFQGLVLSQIPGTQEDGYFTLNEVMNCDYHAKLIVLSACQTGSGKLEKGEGVTGLTRAFMYAGSPAVVAGLWKVDDLAAKELMIHFYKNMIDKKMSKPEALRQAKMALVKDGKYASPYYWSAFVLYGE